MGQIQVAGMKGLDDMEIDAVNRLAQRYLPKIERELRNDVDLLIHIKKYKKLGVWWKYHINIRTQSPGRSFVSSKAIDWDINKTLHKAFKDIINQVQHAFHTEGHAMRIKKMVV